MARCKASPALPLQAPPVAPSRRGGGSTDDLGYATTRVLVSRRNRSGSAAAPLPLRGADHVIGAAPPPNDSAAVDQRRAELAPNSNDNFRLQTEGTNELLFTPVSSDLCHCFHCSQIHGKRCVHFECRDVVSPAQPPRRDRNVVITGKPPSVGFSSPSDFNPITWSPGTVCCLARSEVRA